MTTVLRDARMDDAAAVVELLGELGYRSPGGDTYDALLNGNNIVIEISRRGKILRFGCMVRS
jgi:hypothetical protein